MGLGIEALHKGFKVSFVTMDTLIQLLKTQEISRQAKFKMKRTLDSDLIILDDLMFMAMDRNEANLFFQFINKVYGESSLIITSNKGPADWGELLGDLFTGVVCLFLVNQQAWFNLSFFLRLRPVMCHIPF